MEKPASQGIIASPKPTTTFVHVDTDTFRDIVQRLTGPSDGESSPTLASSSAPTAAAAHGKLPTGLRKPNSTSRLHERRQYSMRPKLEIVKPVFHHKIAAFSPSKTGRNSGFAVSPLGTPCKTFSKLSIIDVEANRAVSNAFPSHQLNSEEEEEKAIKERRFYLHPSPRSKPGYTEPELLTLFPLTSPKLDQP